MRIYFVFCLLCTVMQPLGSMEQNMEPAHQGKKETVSEKNKDYQEDKQLIKYKKSEKKFRVMIVGRGLDQGLKSIDFAGYPIPHYYEYMSPHNCFVMYVDPWNKTFLKKQEEDLNEAQLIRNFIDLGKDNGLLEYLQGSVDIIFIDHSTMSFLNGVEYLKVAEKLLKKGGILLISMLGGRSGGCNPDELGKKVEIIGEKSKNLSFEVACEQAKSEIDQSDFLKDKEEAGLGGWYGEFFTGEDIMPVCQNEHFDLAMVRGYFLIVKPFFD